MMQKLTVLSAGTIKLRYFCHLNDKSHLLLCDELFVVEEDFSLRIEMTKMEKQKAKITILLLPPIFFAVDQPKFIAVKQAQIA